MINNNWLFDQHLGNKSEKRRTHKMLKIFALKKEIVYEIFCDLFLFNSLFLFFIN